MTLLIVSINPLVSLIMAALDILIVWGIIVVAMTVLISVRLFHKDDNHMRTQKMVSKRDKLLKNAKY